VETRPDKGPSVNGYVIVLLGVVGFVVGCFLPYLSGNFLPAEGTISLFRLIWLGAGRPFEQVGGVLYLFAGAATVGVIALLGIGLRRAWTPPALVTGAAAWTLTWIGVLMNQAGFGPHAVGYWVGARQHWNGDHRHGGRLAQCPGARPRADYRRFLDGGRGQGHTRAASTPATPRPTLD